MAEQKDAPTAKRRRYSREPDLKVIVEGETFHVHSRDLMSASDVFASMLESDMREVEEGQIVLPGKCKEEFRTLLRYISVSHGAALPDINKDNVEFLLKWADEYQIVGLTSRCEDFIQREINGYGDKDIVGRLHLAVQYKLEGLQERASKKLAAEILKYRCEAAQFVDNPSIMNLLLPALFRAARIQPLPTLLTEKVEARDVWPLVERSVEAMKGFKGIDDLRWMATTYRKLLDAVYDSIPQQKGMFEPVPDGVSLDDLKKLHMKRFGGEMVQKAVEALDTGNCISRHGATGKYFRNWNSGSRNSLMD